jgi:hypothetical protein
MWDKSKRERKTVVEEYSFGQQRVKGGERYTGMELSWEARTGQDAVSAKGRSLHRAEKAVEKMGWEKAADGRTY